MYVYVLCTSWPKPHQDQIHLGRKQTQFRGGGGEYYTMRYNINRYSYICRDVYVGNTSWPSHTRTTLPRKKTKHI